MCLSRLLCSTASTSSLSSPRLGSGALVLATSIVLLPLCMMGLMLVCSPWCVGLSVSIGSGSGGATLAWHKCRVVAILPCLSTPSTSWHIALQGFHADLTAPRRSFLRSHLSSDGCNESRISAVVSRKCLAETRKLQLRQHSVSFPMKIPKKSGTSSGSPLSTSLRRSGRSPGSGSSRGRGRSDLPMAYTVTRSNSRSTVQCPARTKKQGCGQRCKSHTRGYGKNPLRRGKQGGIRDP